MRAKNGLAGALAVTLATALTPAASARDDHGGATERRAARASSAPPGSTHQGRPNVVLDQLDLAKAPLPSSDEKYLREVLATEARRADWGAGRRSKIQYRFRVDELEVTEDATVVKIRCTATGWLPRGKTAKSRLAFGGAPKERAELVRRVLAIVARGVVTRLAELERQRRLATRPE